MAARPSPPASGSEIFSGLAEAKGVGWESENIELSVKDGLKLRKRVLNNDPLMMKNFRDEAKKILMETIDGLWDQVAPTQTALWLFIFKLLWKPVLRTLSCMCKSAGFHRKACSLPITL